MPKITALPNTTVPAATDIVPFVDNSGTPTTRKATVANLAASAAFGDEYASLDGARLFVPMTGALQVLGTVTVGHFLRRVVATMPADITGVAALGGVVVPSGWATVDITAVWCLAVDTGGSVRLRVDMALDSPGTIIAASPTAGPNNTVAAPSVAGEVVHSTLATAVAVTPGHLLALNIVRLGVQPADTLDGNMHWLGLIVERAS